MEERKTIQTKTIVITAFFAAITFLGIQSFRIPMPAAVGTPFVHFGHIFVVMGVLLQGGKRGAISGTAGLIIFDLLNGYIAAMPQVFVETIVKCLIVGAIFSVMRKRHDRKNEFTDAVVCALIYGCMNVVIEFVMGIIMMMVAGSGFGAAFMGSLTSIPATVINAVFMIGAIAVLYKPVKAIYVRIQ